MTRRKVSRNIKNTKEDLKESGNMNTQALFLCGKYNIYIKIYINIILRYIKRNERKIILLDIYKKTNKNILKLY